MIMTTELKNTVLQLISITCTSLILLFSSCSSDKDPEPYNSGEQATANFRYYFYENEKVNALKLDNFLETEWGIPLENADKACKAFRKITGMDASLTDTYSYSYRSTDGKCTLRIEGKKIPEDAVYAIMYIDIPDCPEFSKIIMATPDYFESTNDYTGKI